MSKHGPIIWLENDNDDQHIIEEVLKVLKPSRTLRMFSKGEDLLQYLRITTEQPFLILCDVNMPGINGLQVRDEINKDENLRRKAIPFIFFSTTAEEAEVRKAYDMLVQGYFEKGNSFGELQARLKRIIDYWNDCKHPNSFDNQRAVKGSAF
jgi:CheY-like chemotaxis protein